MAGAEPTGCLIAVVGPSGAGKDTLIAGAMAARPDLRLARRVITRPTEAGGEDFDGVSEAAFRQQRDAGAFAIHWQAHGLSYGIPASIDEALATGATVLFNGSRAALGEARARYPGLRVILVTAPVEVLAARLAARGRETADDIAARLARKTDPAPEDAEVVVNDGAPEAGIARLLDAISRSEGSV
ncbi:phosphonate metabolism protein/1,5-bisphosphokinase (PRPP-forming) PhnN [Rhodobacteraceae bacterium NNCM2]|nr:phosphonate metabolism protein/1,5-bisphosphokinase (PRPP-forming) PhnN [Coraliihabitans acroporae]